MESMVEMKLKLVLFQEKRKTKNEIFHKFINNYLWISNAHSFRVIKINYSNEIKYENFINKPVHVKHSQLNRCRNKALRSQL